MKRALHAISLLSIAALLFTAPGCSLTAVHTGTLLREMTDLTQLTQLPDPAFTCHQASSYDRKSTTPDDYEGWFANADYGQFVATEERDGRTEHVLVDVAGPGTVVRIWSANPKGTLRVYLDHNPTPALEGPMDVLLSGRDPRFPEPLAGVRARGFNLHFPLPYARHCKITSDAGGFYYHVNYRTYPPGTAVRTFTVADLDREASLIAAVCAALANVGRTTEPPPQVAIELLPGYRERHELSTSFPAAVESFELVVEAEDRIAALRETLLTMTFDGHTTVAVPVGDFFGAGPGINPYDSLPLGVTPDGIFWSRWPMPFRNSAIFEFQNFGRQTVRLGVRARPIERPWTNRSLYFNAGWRVTRDVPARPFIDWNYVGIRGQGVFVGAAFSVVNPVVQWWGEGDEKIYVDDEKFPSHFGTGTEDYFGYAWCSNEPFEHAYHAQPRADAPGNKDTSAVNRWHLLDKIPFTRSFRFDMEIWHARDNIVIEELAVATYWYARPGATSNHAPLASGELHTRSLPVATVTGALEGERLAVRSHTGTLFPQDVPGCSGNRHLWWRGGRVGDVLELAFEPPVPGRYKVFGRFVKANDYGVFRLAINGEDVADTVDLYNPTVVASEERLLGAFLLRAGENRFTAQVVGRNEAAAEQYMFGLDYLRLEPVAQP